MSKVNGVRLVTMNPGYYRGAAAAGTICRGQWAKPGLYGNLHGGYASISGVTDRAGVPGGYRHPGAWKLAHKAGGLSSRFEVNGDGAIASANLAGGLNAEASLAGSGSLVADGTMLIIAAATLAGLGALSADAFGTLDAGAALAGSSSVSAAIAGAIDGAASLSGSALLSADIAGAIQGSASLFGSGALSGDLAGAILATATLAGSSGVSADVIGAWFMSANLAGASSVEAAMTGIASAVASILGTGSVSNADMRATAGMSATISVSTSDPLSPQSLAAAVWNALVATYQAPGSMGEAMATAGAGGLSPTQADMLLRLYQLAGLDPTKPLVVTATSRKVPENGSDIEQTIDESSGTITVTRQ